MKDMSIILGRFGDASADVLTAACEQWALDDPEDYEESTAKIGRGELRYMLAEMVGPHAVPEFVFGVIDGEGKFRRISHMGIEPIN